MGNGRVDFDRGIARLSSYAREHGHACPTVDEEWLSWRVGRWVAALRAKFRAGKLTDEQIATAEAIGLRLSPPYREPKPTPPTRAERQESGMLRRLAQLEHYYLEHKHINVRQVHGIDGWPGAGRWVARIRSLYRQGSLAQSVISKAEELNINWNPGTGFRADLRLPKT